jgi:hypothetical protein
MTEMRPSLRADVGWAVVCELRLAYLMSLRRHTSLPRASSLALMLMVTRV